jgi:hypothetical protein
MTRLLLPVILNPNWLFCTPKLASQTAPVYGARGWSKAGGYDLSLMWMASAIEVLP